MRIISIVLMSLFLFSCSAFYDKTEFGNYVYKGNDWHVQYAVKTLDDEFEGYKKSYQEFNWSLVDLNGGYVPHCSLNLIVIDNNDSTKADNLYLQVHRKGFNWMFIKSLSIKLDNETKEWGWNSSDRFTDVDQFTHTNEWVLLELKLSEVESLINSKTISARVYGDTYKADIPIMEYVQDNWKKFYNAHIKGKDLNIN